MAPEPLIPIRRPWIHQLRMQETRRGDRALTALHIPVAEWAHHDRNISSEPDRRVALRLTGLSALVSEPTGHYGR